MKRMALLSILAIGALFLGLTAWRLLHKKSPESVKAVDAAASAPSSQAILDSPQPTHSRNPRNVDPLFELDSMIRGFLAETDSALSAEIALLESKTRWESLKRDGGTLWRSEVWMKPREDYHEMETIALTNEVFSRSIFAFEMGIYDDPRFGLIRMRIMHEGFAELCSRDDLWEGILEYYDSTDSDIRYGLSPEGIFRRSATLSELSKLFLYLPELKEQVKGRERLFVEAQIRSLDAFVQYLAATKDLDWDKVGIFFREPIVIAETALTLLQSDDKQTFSRIRSSLEGRIMRREQDPIELRIYLEAVIASFDAEYL